MNPSEPLMVYTLLLGLGGDAGHGDRGGGGVFGSKTTILWSNIL